MLFKIDYKILFNSCKLKFLTILKQIVLLTQLALHFIRNKHYFNISTLVIIFYLLYYNLSFSLYNKIFMIKYKQRKWSK